MPKSDWKFGSHGSMAERATRSSVVLLTTPSVVTQPGAAREEHRGEQHFSLQHLSSSQSHLSPGLSLYLEGLGGC